MITIRFAAAMIPLLTLSACVPLPSLNPLWDEGHAVNEPALAGTWISEDDDEVMTIMQTDRDEYRMVYVSGEEASQYEVHAVRLEGRLFLDLCPDEALLEERLHGEAYLPLIPTHFFVRVVLEPDWLELATLDDDAIEKYLDRGEIDTPNAKSASGLLLTGQTDQLQDLVVRLADDPDVWSALSRYHRCGGE